VKRFNFQVFFIILFFTIAVFAQNPKEFSLKDLDLVFKNEIQNAKNSLDFQILDTTYAIFNFVGGFADGKYNLQNYKITPLKENIYKIEMLFVKKKGVFSYQQQAMFYFWHHKNQIVFLTPKGKKRFNFQKPSMDIQKTPSGYKITKSTNTNTFELPIESGKIYLKIKR